MARRALPLLVLVVVTALLGVVQLPVPPGRDQGIFLYHGWGINQGMVPYRDIWDHKTPGVYWFYATALALFGDRYESVNALDIVWRLLTAFAIFALGGRLGGGREGLVSALVYIVWSSTWTAQFWFTAQPDGLMVLPLTLAIHFHLDTTPRRQLLAGLAAGVACVLKPTAILIYPLLLASVILRRRAAAARDLALIALGSAAIALAVIASFARHGAISDLWLATVAFNRLHAQVGMPAIWLFRQLQTLFLLLLVPCVGAWVAALVRRRQRGYGADVEPASGMLLLTAWLAVSTAMMLSQQKYFGYHFFVMIGPLALIAGRGLVEAFAAAGRVRRRGIRRLAIAAVGGVVIAGCGEASADFTRTFVTNYRSIDYLLGRSSRVEFVSRFTQADVHLGHTLAAATYLAARTTTDDRVLVWGFEPLINYWAKRRAPTRFDFDLPLVVAASDPPAAALRDRWRRTFLAEFDARPPRYIVVAHGDDNHLEVEASTAQLRSFPEFAQRLASDYVHDQRIGDFALYRRSR